MFCHALSCEKISSQKGKVVNSLSQNFQTKNGEGVKILCKVLNRTDDYVSLQNGKGLMRFCRIF